MFENQGNTCTISVKEGVATYTIEFELSRQESYNSLTQQENDNMNQQGKRIKEILNQVSKQFEEEFGITETDTCYLILRELRSRLTESLILLK